MSYLEYTSMGSMSKFITSGMMMLLSLITITLNAPLSVPQVRIPDNQHRRFVIYKVKMDG